MNVGKLYLNTKYNTVALYSLNVGDKVRLFTFLPGVGKWHIDIIPDTIMKFEEDKVEIFSQAAKKTWHFKPWMRVLKYEESP
jgi:hypothetical protein